MDIERLKMKIFFTWAWKKKPIFCQCGCGEKLPNGEVDTSVMDHLCEKSKFPELKYSPLNIGYFTPSHHANKTNGHPNQKQKEMISWVIENYDIVKKNSSNFESKIEKLIHG